MCLVHQLQRELQQWPACTSPRAVSGSQEPGPLPCKVNDRRRGGRLRASDSLGYYHRGWVALVCTHAAEMNLWSSFDASTGVLWQLGSQRAASGPAGCVFNDSVGLPLVEFCSSFAIDIDSAAGALHGSRGVQGRPNYSSSPGFADLSSRWS